MPSFSSSEISSMILNKKYKIKRGDNLSALADRFQGSFVSAKCMNKNNLMDKIYESNKHAFGGNNNLNFLRTCRCHLKIDKSKKNYIFTDEDRLIFALKGNDMWDDFCKCDKELCEYWKWLYRNSSGSASPKSFPMLMKAGSSGISSSKNLLETIKKKCSSSLKGVSLKMVTTDAIVKEFFNLMGKSASRMEIHRLGAKLEMENKVSEACTMCLAHYQETKSRKSVCTRFM